MSIKSKRDYILDCFRNNPGKELKLKEIDEMVKAEYLKDTGSTDIYTNRTVRDLPKRGFITELNGYIKKPKRGVYTLIYGKIPSIKKSPFSTLDKKKIKKRDHYKCQMCGIPETREEILAIDHIEPEDSGGKGEYNNGITLCGKCNNIKSNLKVTTFGKKMFEKYRKIMLKKGDSEIVDFLNEVLEIYKKYNRN